MMSSFVLYSVAKHRKHKMSFGPKKKVELILGLEILEYVRVTPSIEFKKSTSP